MSIRTITAMFDSADAANRARERLVEVGVPSDSVQVIYQGATGGGADSDGKGLWESIKEFFTGDDDDRATYEEGIRRGGHLLTARVEDQYADEVMVLLENADAIDLDRRADEWRAEGWTGPTTASIGTEAPPLAGMPAAAAEASRADSEEAIPVVRERLRVGKREVNRGGVRARSYVVEEPIEEQVTETSEEAVVSKDAGVTEEVVVRKFEGERTEGVSDTVRRTEVEVEDTRDDEDTRDVIPPGDAGKRPLGTRTDRPSRQ